MKFVGSPQCLTPFLPPLLELLEPILHDDEARGRGGLL